MPASSHDQVLVSYATSADDNELMLMWTTDSKLKAFVDGSSIDLFPSTNLDDGNEHTVSVTWDQSSGQFLAYIDGTLEDSETIAQGVTLYSGGTLMFGQEQDSVGGSFVSSQRFEGQITEARLFNDIYPYSAGNFRQLRQRVCRSRERAGTGIQLAVRQRKRRDGGRPRRLQ